MKRRQLLQTIFVTGGGGFVGGNFLSAPPSGYRIVAPHHTEVDILNLKKLRDVFEAVKPDVVINFAAYRNATAAEEERGKKQGMVWKTNVIGAEYLSRLAYKYKSFLIHISTDMVFGGSIKRKGPFDEYQKADEQLHHLSWYGWTKAEAERILEDKKNVAIIRIGNVTQPIYDPSRDYVGKIAYLLDQNRLYPLFCDQYLTLTAIPSLMAVIHALIRKRKTGVFHVGSTNIFTPYALGIYLAKKTGKRANDVRTVSITDYLRVSPNRYPQYGGLLARQTQASLGVRFSSWQAIVDRFVSYASSAPHQ